MPRTNVEVARTLLTAYREQDRALAESLLAPELTFTSPQDDHLDRAVYLERCFPTADRFVTQELLWAVDLDADHVVVVYEYEYELRAGGRFRNVEVHTVRGGRAVEIQVFFGGEV